MRKLLWAAAVLTACAPPPAAVEQPKPDPAAETAYAEATEQLAAANRQAEALFARSKFDDAAAVITQGQSLQNRLLAAPRPTLPAMLAASDLDDLYGRMLLRNQQYGWARTVFQKNLARWSHWKPQTPETLHRLEQASAAIAECDRRLTQ